MTHNIPPLTIDDLLQATGKRRRNMQEIVRQYVLITGTQVQHYKRRNFFEVRLTEQQRDQILQGMRLADEQHLSYADAFRQLANRAQSPSVAEWTPAVAAALREKLETLNERLDTLHTWTLAMESKLDRVLEALAASGEGAFESPVGPATTKTKRATSSRSKRKSTDVLGGEST